MESTNLLFYSKGYGGKAFYLIKNFLSEDIFIPKLIYFHVLAFIFTNLKGPFLGLRQFLAAESPLKVIENGFYFMLKALFVYTIFRYLSGSFGHLGKGLDKKAKLKFKIYDVTNWQINNYKT